MLFTKFGPISSQSGIMLDGWSYGSVLTIPSGTVSEDLYNFPATVYLNSSNFDFSKAKSDGSDIRFTDKDLNHLKFERVEHTIGGGTAPIKYLYNSGDQCTSITGGWSKVNITGSPTVTFGASNISIVSPHWTDGYLTTANTIDTTGYDSLVVEYSRSGAGGGYMLLHTRLGIVASTDIIKEESSILVPSPASIPIVNSGLKLEIGFANTNTATIYITKIYLTSTMSENSIGKYTVQIPQVYSSQDTEIYMWYGNPNAYNASIESWQDQTGKQLTYNGATLITGIEPNRHVAKFDDANKYFSIPGSIDFNFGTDDMTIEYIVNRYGASTNGIIFCSVGDKQWNYLVGGWNTGFDGNGTGKIIINWSTGSSAIAGQWGSLVSNASIPLNTPTHIAFVRRSGVMYCYINGVLDSSVSYPYSMTYSGNPLIGRHDGRATVTNLTLQAYVYGMRITKGSARYSSDFTTPLNLDVDGSDVVFCTNFDTIYDSNYAMVQHMGDHLIDATGNGNNGTATGTTIISTKSYYKESTTTANSPHPQMGSYVVTSPVLNPATGEFTFGSISSTITQFGANPVGSLAIAYNQLPPYTKYYELNASPFTTHYSEYIYNDFGKARSFNGSSDGIVISSMNLSNTSQITATILEKHYNANGSIGILMEHSSDFNSNNAFVISVAQTSGYHNIGQHTTSGHNIVDGNTLLIDTIYAISGVVNRFLGSSEETKLYLNGINNKITQPYVVDLTGNFTTFPLYIGTRNNASYRVNGIIYAVRLSNIARSDAWVKAESLALKAELFQPISNV